MTRDDTLKGIVIHVYPQVQRDYPEVLKEYTTRELSDLPMHSIRNIMDLLQKTGDTFEWIYSQSKKIDEKGLTQGTGRDTVREL